MDGTMKEKVTARFLRYVQRHTTSDPGSATFPSTPQQMTFALLLADELESLGFSEVVTDVNGYVRAVIPSNISGDLPVVGFVAHMDTSPDFSGEGVQPRVIDDYDGREILLDRETGMTLDPEEFPELKAYAGQTLITSSGRTLLGADDKAGIAEIVTAGEILLETPQIRHGKIVVCFTPDEEIGRGADRFDVSGFGADFAFTLDGGEVGELQYENFNAAQALVSIQGKSVHPGDAKGKMVNALLLAHRIVGLLPERERPDQTEGYEGFFHLVSQSGNVEKAELQFLIRDHDGERFRQRKELLAAIAGKINGEYAYAPVTLRISDQYYNMREMIEPVMYVVDLARDAILAAGVTPKIRAVRGGTDGARLSWMGVPCPNLFTGGHNFHGPCEFIPVESMVKAVEVILNICRQVPALTLKQQALKPSGNHGTA